MDKTNNIDSNEINPIDIIITILIGLVVGIIFGYIMFKRKIYKGPNSNKIVKEIHEDSNGKYTWEPTITICPLGTIHKSHE